VDYDIPGILKRSRVFLGALGESRMDLNGAYDLCLVLQLAQMHGWIRSRTSDKGHERQLQTCIQLF